MMTGCRREYLITCTHATAGSTNWCKNVFDILDFIDLRECYASMLVVNLDECKTRLQQKQQASWQTAIQQKPKLRFYVLFKNSLEPEKYVSLNLSRYERSVLAQIRLGILKIHVETGRFTNTKLEDRICKVCNEGVIEDEDHFLFQCEAYNDLRNSWIDKIYDKCPHFHYLEPNDQFRFVFCDIPRATAKFIISCLDLRKLKLYN
jgi:hypothetical protein